MTKKLKTKIFTIETGDDAGKVFEFTRMPAMPLERWAHDVVYQASVAGMDTKNVDVSACNLHSNSGILAIVGALGSILGRIPPDESLRLKYEILNTCVRIVPTGGQPRMVIWDSEIEDAATPSVLFIQVIGFMTGFLQKGET